MTTPIDRDSFKQFCLRKLGFPVIEVNVTDDQVDDRVDEALQYYADYHFDGSEKIYYSYQVSDVDKSNHYITLPANSDIIGVTRIFNVGDPSIRNSDIFNIRYQISLNDLYSLTSMSLIPYYLAMEHLSLIQQILVGAQQIRFNRHMGRIYADMDWTKLDSGNFILFEAYQKLNPDTWPDVWNDRWLQRYATCLIKQQWGSNLTKYIGVKLTSGIQFNGQKIYDDATAERKELEDEMIFTFSLPASDFWG